jgi:hypothetical protein
VFECVGWVRLMLMLMLRRIPMTHYVGVEIARQDAVETPNMDDGDLPPMDQRAHSSLGHTEALRDLGDRQELCAHTSITQIRVPLSDARQPWFPEVCTRP